MLALMGFMIGGPAQTSVTCRDSAKTRYVMMSEILVLGLNRYACSGHCSIKGDLTIGEQPSQLRRLHQTLGRGGEKACGLGRDIQSTGNPLTKTPTAVCRVHLSPIGKHE